jgi:hypothetical protein
MKYRSVAAVCICLKVQLSLCLRYILLRPSPSPQRASDSGFIVPRIRNLLPSAVHEVERVASYPCRYHSLGISSQFLIG